MWWHLNCLLSTPKLVNFLGILFKLTLINLMIYLRSWCPILYHFQVHMDSKIGFVLPVNICLPFDVKCQLPLMLVTGTFNFPLLFSHSNLGFLLQQCILAFLSCAGSHYLWWKLWWLCSFTFSRRSGTSILWSYVQAEAWLQFGFIFSRENFCCWIIYQIPPSFSSHS